MEKECQACGAVLISESNNYCSYCDAEIEPSEATINPNTLDSEPVPIQFSTSMSYYGEPEKPQKPKKKTLKVILITAGAILGTLLVLFIALVVISLLQGRNFVHYGSPSTSPLLGTWENGRGNIVLFVFGGPDAVEFRENGTIRIIEGENTQIVDWETGANGTFRADAFIFSYSIDGNYLIIIDSWNDVWRFDRAD